MTRREGEARGHHQKSVPVTGGDWMAVLLASLWQLSKLLAMHAGGVAADTGRLMKGRKEAKRGRRGGRGGSAVQQWWRQMRSNAHQQRCGWRQMCVEAGLEQACGEEAGGAAPVEAAPLARPRG